MKSKGILLSAMSLALMVGVPAWAGDHDGDEHGHGKHAAGYHENEGAYHGKKKGWRGCDLPPGQAKKYGCVAPPPPPPAHVVVVTPPPPQAHVVVVTPPPPPPPRVQVVVAVPAPPPPPPSGVSIHVDAVLGPKH